MKFRLIPEAVFWQDPSPGTFLVGVGRSTYLHFDEEKVSLYSSREVRSRPGWGFPAKTEPLSTLPVGASSRPVVIEYEGSYWVLVPQNKRFPQDYPENTNFVLLKVSNSHKKGRRLVLKRRISLEGEACEGVTPGTFLIVNREYWNEVVITKDDKVVRQNSQRSGESCLIRSKGNYTENRSIRKVIRYDEGYILETGFCYLVFDSKYKLLSTFHESEARLGFAFGDWVVAYGKREVFVLGWEGWKFGEVRERQLQLVFSYSADILPPLKVSENSFAVPHRGEVRVITHGRLSDEIISYVSSGTTYQVCFLPPSVLAVEWKVSLLGEQVKLPKILLEEVVAFL